MSIFSLSAVQTAADEITQEPPLEEIQYDKVKFQCENMNFESPHPERNQQNAKAWHRPIEMKTSDSNNQSVKLIPNLSRNRGAIGPAGSWNVLDWFDPIHVYSSEYADKKTEDKEERFPYYVIQVLTVKEAYILKYEKEGDYKMTPCKPAL